MSSQYRVCSSVQPGIAKLVGAVTDWLGRTATRWCVRAGGLERCTGAASAETHKVINTPRARTTRIAFAQSVSRKGYQLIMCARAASAPSCSGFTIGQICGIMSPCPSSPASGRLPWGDARRGRSRSFDLLLRLSAQIPTTSPPPYDESRKAYLGYYAYWGAYTINDAGNGVIRNVQGSERPGEGWIKIPEVDFDRRDENSS